MRVGLQALGIGPGARPDVIRAVAVAAEAAGFATLWSGEHVVLVDRPVSRYPYSADGRISVPAGEDWLDPLLGLTFAAAVTSRIMVGTGVLLLPEHNPVLAAKQAATLDVLSGGRLILGIGIGWSQREYQALGASFESRGPRLDEMIRLFRTVWENDTADFDGTYYSSFEQIRVLPRPAHRIPIWIGGSSKGAVDRALRNDGYHALGVKPQDAKSLVDDLRSRRPDDDFVVSMRLAWDVSKQEIGEIAEPVGLARAVG